MTNFIGKATAKIDDKGRLIFPSVFKACLPAEDTRLVIKKDIYTDCLQVFAYGDWEKQSLEVKSKLNFFNPKHAAFWRMYMSDCSVVEPDPKMGRIGIPKELLEQIGAEKEVIFSGCIFYIEIWAKDRRSQSMIENDEYREFAESVLGTL